MEMLKLENVDFRYSYNYIFEKINLTIIQGRRYALIGPSGGGKTTLLKLCANLINVSNGRRTANYRVPSMVFQDDRLFPWLTIEKNIVLSTYHLNNFSGVQNIKTLLTDVHLNDEILQLFPQDLSGGMKQRVSFIRALINNPDIIFLDEPFSALDFSIKEIMCHKLNNYLGSSTASILLVTHDLTDALKLCDEIAIVSPVNKNLEWLTDLPERDRRDEIFIKNYIESFTHNPKMLKLFIEDKHHA